MRNSRGLGASLLVTLSWVIGCQYVSQSNIPCDLSTDCPTNMHCGSSGFCAAGSGEGQSAQGVPGAPTSVVATAGDQQITATWKAPKSAGNSPIFRYTVVLTPGGLMTTTGTTTTITGLTNGTSYVFTVYATNAQGDGSTSAPSNAVTPGILPAAPLNVMATAGCEQATVTWSTPPPSDGGTAIISYTVTPSPADVPAINTGSMTATFTGLANGTTYTFFVSASNSVGPGPAAPSEPVTPAASDNNNCGTCGNSCTSVAPNATCQSGMCACPSGDSVCSGTCVDKTSANENCGTCGNACTSIATNATCQSGTCGCPSSLSLCSGTCVDKTSDNENCGTCGNACSTHDECGQGTCMPSWWNAAPTSSPPARHNHAMVFDSTRRVTVLFGGELLNVTYSNLDDTWEWNGTNWTQMSPATSPPGGGDSAMVYDSQRSVTVLFGGVGASTFLNDTWEWNGTNWTQMSPATSPPARDAFGMAYDSARGVTVLFGGYIGYGSSFLNDTWEWNGTTWTQMSPATSPPSRTNHAMVFDSTRGDTVLFGGGGGPPNYSGLNDTWEWNGTNWTQMSPATRPAARAAHAMAYDSTRDVTVLFGGNGPSGVLNDTWEWNGTIWIQTSLATSPSARAYLAMAYDSARDATVLFGGQNGGGGSSPDLNDTWEWSDSP